MAPSTLNRVIENNPDYKWVLSVPTLALLEEFRNSLGGRKSVKDVEVGGDTLEEPLDTQLLSVWGRLDDDVKEATLGLFAAFTSMLARKVAQSHNVTHGQPSVAGKKPKATQ